MNLMCQNEREMEAEEQVLGARDEGICLDTTLS